jgi:acetyltransferase-like isoleucine patch superfamily enzyme
MPEGSVQPFSPRVALEWLIGRTKRDPTYRLSGDYAARDLVEETSRRGWEAFRGLLLASRIGHSELPVFCGRRVRVRHGRLLTVGRATVVADDVLLNALSRDGLRLGRNVTVGRGATLTCTGVFARPGVGVRIGDRVGIGEYSHIGGQGGVSIGNDVLLGPGVRIFSENHSFGSVEVPIRQQGEERAAVVIENDCWIGAGVIILAGVRIGTQSVVGAGAIVARDLPPRSIALGVPARVVAERGPGHA